MNKRVTATAALIVTAVLAAACSSGPSDSIPVEGGEPYEFAEVVHEDPSVPVDGDVGEVTEQDCPSFLAGTGMRCVWVTVPVDRDDTHPLDGPDPLAVNAGVSVVIRPGTGDQSLTPLVVLNGGPGGASSELAFSLPSRPYTQVLIDQRGVGFGSANFWCSELLHALVDIVEATRERAEAIASEASARCADRLRSNPVFAETSTAAHAADVVGVMAALGYDRWFLYGVSYGTTIALEVLRHAPAGLAGAVLDGVYPAHLDLDAAVASGADRVIRELDDECRADPVCAAILAGGDDGEGATMAELLVDLIPRLNAEPIVVSLAADETTMREPIEALIDGDSVAGAVFQMLYNELSATLVPGVLAGLARHEDAGAIDATTEAGVPTAPGLVAMIGVESASQQFHGGAPATHAAVTCAEWLRRASGPPTGVGEFAAAVVGEGLAALCEPWAIEESPLQPEPVRSDLPVLLISGWFDPITPPSFAEEAAEHLPRSTHIVSRTRGHGIWVWGYDSCVDRIVADFLAEPGVELDVACASEDRPLRWQPLPS